MLRKTVVLSLILIILAVLLSLMFQNGLISITGFASTANATATVNLSEEVSIKTSGSIDFGEGRVYSNATFSFLDSSISGSDSVVNGSWNYSLMPKYIQIENDGTVNISISVNADGNKNAAGLIGGTSPLFQVKGVETESGSCNALNTTYRNVPNSTETPLLICDSLGLVRDSDSFNVSIKFKIPENAVPGNRTALLTFTATKV